MLRTGGFAGLRREWRAEPPAEDAPRWIVLIDECPWDGQDAPTPTPTPTPTQAPTSRHTPSRGADRFVWSIHAASGGAARRARVTDGDLQGPWRELVDEVRRFADG